MSRFEKNFLNPKLNYFKTDLKKSRFLEVPDSIKSIFQQTLIFSFLVEKVNRFQSTKNNGFQVCCCLQVRYTRLQGQKQSDS